MQYLSVFSPNAGKCGENAGQINSEYGHFLRSDCRCFNGSFQNFKSNCTYEHLQADRNFKVLNPDIQ